MYIILYIIYILYIITLDDSVMNLFILNYDAYFLETIQESLLISHHDDLK